MFKRQLLVPVLLLCQQAAFSQHVSISFYWPSTTVAYLGADNKLSCTVEGFSCKRILLSTDNGKFTKDGCNYYTFRPDHIADSKIIVSKKVGKKSHKIGEFFLRVRAIPNPVAIVGGLHGGSISKGTLRAQTGIGASPPPDLSLDIKYWVNSYSITIIRNREMVFFKSCDGNLFTEEIYTAFKDLQKGDIILFSSINVLMPNEEKKLADPFELRIE